MSRSERYIPPSDEELQRLRLSIEAAKQFDHQREELHRTALKKFKRVDLVELTLRVAQQGKESQWTLEQEVGLEKPVDLLVHDVEVAIDQATQVDERQLNYNFEFSWRAYDAGRSQDDPESSRRISSNSSTLEPAPSSSPAACRNHRTCSDLGRRVTGRKRRSVK